MFSIALDKEDIVGKSNNVLTLNVSENCSRICDIMFIADSELPPSSKKSS